jgi:hypothetical protein
VAAARREGATEGQSIVIVAGVTCLLLGYVFGPSSLYAIGGILLAVGLILRIVEAKYLSPGGRNQYCQCDPRQAMTDVVGTRLGERVQCLHAGPGCPHSIQRHAARRPDC